MAALNAGKQVTRASASVAANYRAAQRGKSRAYFANKIAIVLEEADESAFWLEYIERGRFIAAKRLTLLRAEANELVRIFAVMLKSARK
jgi:four helix bundle protein